MCVHIYIYNVYNVYKIAWAKSDKHMVAYVTVAKCNADGKL